MTNYTFQSLFAFTRTTSGTFVGSNGLIQNTPASVNLFTQTQQFDNAAWTKSNATVTANSTVAPDGTSTADTLIENTSNAFHAAVQSFTLSGATTISCYLKANTRSFAAVRTFDATNGDRYAVFNLSTGATGVTSGGTTSTITSVGNGWYRCSMTYTYTSASGSAGITVQNANSYVAYTGDGTSGIFVWGAQLEAGAFATSYIPTIASTVTRSADVATITGSLFSQWYGQPQGTFVVNADVGSVASGDKYVLIVNDANGRITYVSTAAINTFDGTTVTSSGQSASANTPFKSATAWSGSTLSISANGAAAVGGAFDGAFGTGTDLRIGSNAGGFSINGHIQSVQYYPVRAADFQLQALTT